MAGPTTKLTGLMHAKYTAFAALLYFLLQATLFKAQCGSTITAFPYSEGFEAGAAWTSGGTNSTWAWGTPAHPTISSAGGGTKSWCSAGLTGSSYSSSQQSWIMSPCFDFTNLNYPWISFKIFWECEYIWDGMVLQYSTNGGTTWLNVGAYNDPVNCLNDNWFNYNNISNLTTASPKHGWCGRAGATSGSCSGGNGSLAWVTAKHCMSNLANQPSVKFRFLFGSGTTCNSYDGIAIDDILIQNAPANAANFSYACSGATTASFTNLSTQCPTTYTWNFGDPASGAANTSYAQNPSHVFSSPGTYTVGLTAAGPCNASNMILLPVTILSLSTSASSLSCNGAGTASISVNASGGSGPYSYTWAPGGQNTSSISVINAGTYSVAVSSPGSCPVKTTVVMLPPSALTANASVTNISCYSGSNGAASVTAVGGAPAYSYSWSPGNNTTAGITALGPGTYSVVVSDANNCKASAIVTVTQPSAGLTATSVHTNVLCFNAASGAIKIIASGGTPGYSYAWYPVTANTASLNNLSAGNYTVLVQDANNCTATITAAVTQPAASLSAVISTSNVMCYGAATGAASVTASGGTPAYTYTWSPAGSNNTLAGSLAAGIYSVTVSDANNCSYATNAFIPQPLSVLATSISATNVSCFGAANGVAVATAYGGAGNYTYTWSPSGGNNSVAQFLQPNVYSIIVKDANNCTATAATIITQPAAPLSAYIIPANILCYGLINGSANAIASGGTQPYTYTWSPAGGNAAFATGLSVSPYTVAVKDASNCVTSATTIINQPAMPLSLSAASGSVTCFGGSDGSASITPSGGTPGYTYNWSHGPLSLAATNTLSAGIYTVLVRDANNCSASLPVPINQPLPLMVSLNPFVACANQPAALWANVSGGLAPLSYSWNNLAATSTGSIAVDISAAAVYSVVVTDVKGCISNMDTTVVSVPEKIQLFVNPNLYICQGYQAALTASASGGTGAYNFVWQPGSLSGPTHYIVPQSSVVYTINVSDACNATQSATTNLLYYPVPASNIIKSEAGSCAPVCLSFSNNPLYLSGLVSAYRWDFGDSSSSTASFPHHCYYKTGTFPVSLTYTTINGCTASQIIFNYVHVFPSPTASFTTDKSQVDPYNSTVAITNQSHGASGFSWSFNNQQTNTMGDTTLTFTQEEDQFVVLIASNDYGCKDTVTKLIPYIADFTFFAPNTFSPNHDGLNDLFMPKGINWNTAKYELSIYNRWGERLFETKQYDEGWDGTSGGSGNALQNDVYVWKINLYDIFNKHHEFMGQVLLEK